MKPIATILSVSMWMASTADLEAQRGMGPALVTLSPPAVSVYATPVEVTVAWKPVTGAGSYSVEVAKSPAGPWTALAGPQGGFQITAPTAALTNAAGGMLYYYRVTALLHTGPKGETMLGAPGVTIVPRVTPKLNAPLGVDPRAEGADLRVSWAPVPYATGYVVTVATGQQQQQLVPISSIEVSAPVTEARLVNVLPVNGSSVAYWATVMARYGTGGPVSVATPSKILPSAGLPCSSAVPLVGPAPAVALTPKGPAGYVITTAGTQTGSSLIRVERALMGSATWQQAGCSYMGVIDQGLAFATQYQYRITEIKLGTAGQTIVPASTPPAPDSPVPTASVSACTADGCQVTLFWTNSAGAADYRIESSYGTYMAQLHNGSTGGVAQAGPLSQNLGLVPKGVHTFTVTPLFPLMRPSPKPPGQVTVVVP